MSNVSKAYQETSHSRKGKQEEVTPSHRTSPKAEPSTALTQSAKGLPDPGIFHTRPSHPIHTSPSFERGRRSSQPGFPEPKGTSAQVVGAGGAGEASYSRAGSQNAAPWQSSSSSGGGNNGATSSAAVPEAEPPRRRRKRRGEVHRADTRGSEAWRALGDNYVHASDPEFWRERRLSEEAGRRRRRRESSRTREAGESCCVLL